MKHDLATDAQIFTEILYKLYLLSTCQPFQFILYFSASLRETIILGCDDFLSNVVFERKEGPVKLQTSPKERNQKKRCDEFGPKDEPLRVFEIHPHQTVEVAQIFHHGL